jgi:hypothetical protein
MNLIIFLMTNTTEIRSEPMAAAASRNAGTSPRSPTASCPDRVRNALPLPVRCRTEREPVELLGVRDPTGLGHPTIHASYPGCDLRRSRHCHPRSPLRSSYRSCGRGHHIRLAGEDKLLLFQVDLGGLPTGHLPRKSLRIPAFGGLISPPRPMKARAARKLETQDSLQLAEPGLPLIEPGA